MRFGIIGSGSWATAIVKMLIDNGQSPNWWIRQPAVLEHLKRRGHNPHYLSSVQFDLNSIKPQNDIEAVIRESDCLVLVVPSAYIESLLDALPPDIFAGKKILSAVKGILPGKNLLLNEYLAANFGLDPGDYFTLMGPCHAEEVASEKLSYLTFSGADETSAAQMASYFRNPYLNTIVNTDVFGVQYAAVLKNIYALGAGMAHGLEYGDNFLSVFIANCADEMAAFLQKAGAAHIEVGIHESGPAGKKEANYAASVYLGDLLVTCYSLYSRNRTFGNMIGKGYSVNAARLELNMVAEGYTASKCLYAVNGKWGVDMPIAETVYRVLWEDLGVREGFKHLEMGLV